MRTRGFRNVFFLALLGSWPCLSAQAQAPGDVPSGVWSPGEPVGLEEVGSGELLWKTDRGLVPLPVSRIDVRLTLTGVLLEGKVAQSFHNPTSETIEALYVFPLPDRAAVHAMEMRIGQRTIRSVVQEREQARRTYERARSSGRKAALLDQERPNLFTVSAANINPGETVTVRLEYLEELAWVDGGLSLRFPMTFTSRYSPGGASAGLIDSPGVAAAPNATPSARIEVDLQAGTALRKVASDSHEIRWIDRGDRVLVRTAAERVVANRDFLLRFEPRLEDAPQATVFVEDRADGRYAMMMMLPPTAGSEAGLGLATETLFVVNVSGSMKGPSIRQARQALLAALDRLRPEDRFDILKFNDHSEPLHDGFRNADHETLEAAREWVRGLEAGGGTRIPAALARALELAGSSRSARAQRIIFLTDGAVADEDEVFRLIADRLGPARLHAIGIGHAPNTHLMRKMARFGRGLCDFIADATRAGDRIDAFLARLDRPVMTDLELRWEGLEVQDPHPARLPDLYAGEPLLLYARVGDLAQPGRAILGGYTRAGWIEISVDLASAVEGPGIGTRWARAQVDGLMDSLHEGADAGAVRTAVVELALAFDLVTRYTSLVATDDGPTAMGASRPVRLARLLPQGGTGNPLRRRLGWILVGAALGLLALAKAGRT